MVEYYDTWTELRILIAKCIIIVFLLFRKVYPLEGKGREGKLRKRIKKNQVLTCIDNFR